MLDTLVALQYTHARAVAAELSAVLAEFPQIQAQPSSLGPPGAVIMLYGSTGYAAIPQQYPSSRVELVVDGQAYAVNSIRAAAHSLSGPQTMPAKPPVPPKPVQPSPTPRQQPPRQPASPSPARPPKAPLDAPPRPPKSSHAVPPTISHGVPAMPHAAAIPHAAAVPGAAVPGAAVPGAAVPGAVPHGPIHGAYHGGAVPPRPPKLRESQAPPSLPVDLMSAVTVAEVPADRRAALAVLAARLEHRRASIAEAGVAEAQKDARDLASLEQQVQRLHAELSNEKQQLESNLAALETATASAEVTVGKAEALLVPPDLDDLVRVANRPMEEARAADEAITDLLQLLARALDAGSIELHLYLRLVRQYAREQFGHRYLLQLPPEKPPKG